MTKKTNAQKKRDFMAQNNHTPTATDPLDDLRDELASILYGDWVTYEMVKLGKVAETTTENIDKIVNILTDREQKARVDELMTIPVTTEHYDKVRYYIVDRLATLTKGGDK